MTKFDYLIIAEWLRQQGYINTMLPKDAFSLEVSEYGIDYRESFNGISIGEWPCDGFSLRLLFVNGGIRFCVVRSAGQKFGSAAAAIDYLKDVLEDAYDEYDENIRLRVKF